MWDVSWGRLSFIFLFCRLFQHGFCLTFIHFIRFPWQNSLFWEPELKNASTGHLELASWIEQCALLPVNEDEMPTKPELSRHKETTGFLSRKTQEWLGKAQCQGAKYIFRYEQNRCTCLDLWPCFQSKRPVIKLLLEHLLWWWREPAFALIERRAVGS